MDRRAFIGALAGGLLTAPLAVEAQPTKPCRIVEINPGAPQEQQRVFREALRKLGYVQGQNIVIEDRFAAGSEDRRPEYAAQAVRLKADVVVAISSSAIRAATNASKTIAIVGLDLESDPVASGFIASLARPGETSRGSLSIFRGLTGKGLELLEEAIPEVSRVAVLRDPDLNPAMLRAAEVSARSLGLQLQIVEARVPKEYEGVFRETVKGRISALLVSPSPRFDRGLLSELARKHRLPTTTTIQSAASRGSESPCNGG